MNKRVPDPVQGPMPAEQPLMGGMDGLFLGTLRNSAIAGVGGAGLGGLGAVTSSIFGNPDSKQSDIATQMMRASGTFAAGAVTAGVGLAALQSLSNKIRRR